MKIGIIGIGNVGMQVLKDLNSSNKTKDTLFVEKILVRDKDKYLKILDLEFGKNNNVSEKLTDDFSDFIKLWA